jgi:hypothetical protein
MVAEKVEYPSQKLDEILQTTIYLFLLKDYKFTSFFIPGFIYFKSFYTSSYSAPNHALVPRAFTNQVN